MTARAFIGKHSVLSYFVLTLAISWGGILAVVGGFAGFTNATAASDPLFPLVYVAMLAGPVFACLLVTAIAGGRAGFAELWSRFTTWRIGWWAWAIALLTAPITVLTVLGILSLVSRDFTPGIFSAPDPAATLTFGVLVGLGAGFFEEIGWTGFATPRLLQRMSLLKTGLLLGFVWAIWHVVAVAWGIGSLPGTIPVPVFIALDLFSILPVYRVLMVRLHQRTSSLSAVMLMHASLTSTLLILPPDGLIGSRLLAMNFAIALALWLIAAIAFRQQPASSPTTRSAHV